MQGEIRRTIGKEKCFALPPDFKKQLKEALFATKMLDIHLQLGRNYDGDVVALVTGFESMLTDALTPIYENK